MKLAACFLTLLPGFAVAASWTSPGFPAFSEQGTGTFVSHAQLPKGTRPLTLNFDQQCWQPADAIKLNQMLSLQPCSNTPPQWRLFRDGEYTLQNRHPLRYANIDDFHPERRRTGSKPGP